MIRERILLKLLHKMAVPSAICLACKRISNSTWCQEHWSRKRAAGRLSSFSKIKETQKREVPRIKTGMVVVRKPWRSRGVMTTRSNLWSLLSLWCKPWRVTIKSLQLLLLALWSTCATSRQISSRSSWLKTAWMWFLNTFKRRKKSFCLTFCV